MIRTLLKFRNSDSTLDLNDHLSKFFKRGIVSGGEVTPVPSALSVNVSPFKLIGIDGMVVMETSDPTTLNVVAGVTNVIVFKSQYVANSSPIYGFQVLDYDAYIAASDIEYLTVFAFITLNPSDTQVHPSQIDYTRRDVVDPVGRLTFRGSLPAVSSLPALNNRAGDAYTISSGAGDAPEIRVWNGLNWINVTDTIVIASILNSHRNNLFPNEIHLTNDQSDAVQGTQGTPSNTNRFVTAEDDRVPTVDEADALSGFPSSPVPSASNPYVTASYGLAQPAVKNIAANPGGFLQISSSEGPVYVGVGGVGTANRYFRVYHTSAPREFVNSNGSAVTISGVFKDIALTQALDPSSDPTVIQSNGFYSGNLYLTYTSTINLPCRLLYGQQRSLALIDRGSMLLPQPNAAETTAETLRRLSLISGRLFDDPMQIGESNVELRQSVVNLRQYANATTSADLVIDSSQFNRLRQIPEFAPDFPDFSGEVVIFAGNTAFTVSSTLATVQAFDSYYIANSPDLSVIAIISYSAPVAAISSVKPGHIFIDGANTRFRVLAVNTTGNGSLMIYTGGQTVSNTAGTTSGAVYLANNPRKIEILGDHETSIDWMFIPVTDITPDTDIESLPPGGSFVGTGALYSLIGSSLLPNQGNPNGAPSGRPIWNVLPEKQGNRLDKRVRLIGNWKSDQENYPNQVIGQVSQGSLGFEITSRNTFGIGWYTRDVSTAPYNIRVFVDGVYYTTVYATSPSNISDAISSFRDKEPAMQYRSTGPITLDSNYLHTIRCEVITDGSTPFFLYGFSIYSYGITEEAGRAFLQTDLLKTDFAIISGIVDRTLKGRKEVLYLDRTTQQRAVAVTSAFSVANPLVGINAGDTTYLDPILAPSASVGDVFLYALTDLTQYTTRRIVAVNKATNSITLESSLGFSISGTNGRAEHMFRVPTSASGGSIISAAPVSEEEGEYVRFLAEDWDVGSDRDVANLATDTAESRVTVLNDGITSLLVNQCQLVNTGIEGYSTSIRLNQTSSFVTIQGWGTRIDGIFTGNSGPVSVVVEIDGLYTYTLNLRGDGLERHSFFFKGAAQSHVVRVYQPSLANRVCLGAVIFHNLKSAEVNGTVLAEYTVPRNSTSLGANFDYAPASFNSMTTTSFGGVRVMDITKINTVLSNGTGGSQDWKVVQDFQKNPRFGYYLTTDRPNASITVYGQGNYHYCNYEFYYEANPTSAQANVFINGTLLTSGNFPYLTATEVNLSTGVLDFYSPVPTIKRMVISMSGASYVLAQQSITIVHRGTNNPSAGAGPNYPINAFAFADTPITGAPQLWNLDDSVPSHLFFSSVKDLRRFTTVLPEQGGVVAVPQGKSTGTSGITTIPAISSGLVNLETMPYWFSVYNDFSLDADPPQSPTSPAYPATGFTTPLSLGSNPRALVLSYDCTVGYSLSGGTALTLNKLPSWALSASDVVGAVFQPLSGVDSGKVVRISATTGPLQFTLEALGLTDVVGPINCAIKQCLHTKDLVQFSAGGLNDSVAARLPIPVPVEISSFVSKDINSITVDAEGSIVSGANGAIAAYGSALISYQANIKGVRADGSTPNTADPAYWSAPITLPSYQPSDLPVLYPPSATDNERLFLRIFPAQTSGTGFVNLLRWSVFFFDDLLAEENPSPKKWAFGYTDNSQPSVNCTISVVGGKTRIVFPQSYDFNAFAGTTASTIKLLVDGKEFPRATPGVVISDGYFTEIDPFSIELDSDYSGVGKSIDIRFKELARSQLKIGTFNPAMWLMHGFVTPQSLFDGVRTCFESRTYTRLKLSASNTGASGNTVVQIFKNSSLVATGTLPADGTKNAVLLPVLINVNDQDILEATVSGAALYCQNLTVELA